VSFVFLTEFWWVVFLWELVGYLTCWRPAPCPFPVILCVSVMSLLLLLIAVAMVLTGSSFLFVMSVLRCRAVS
jgi:hypothetical protein